MKFFIFSVSHTIKQTNDCPFFGICIGRISYNMLGYLKRQYLCLYLNKNISLVRSGFLRSKYKYVCIIKFPEISSLMAMEILNMVSLFSTVLNMIH